ncbi:ABCB family ABC transporter ATP-binding protein/permease [Zavarzinia compransoris]|uniref:Metal ABC transporter permease n=1 Tax=Zavarzinia compransoris TaxID=1264899 RepID=A0A317DZ61_9PROT|nr:ABC transporter ATP-binding protein/permease [Zavarzinia compransoris]PWR19712.1 metal ABC transporter permease [Zavarzinia compransoris]TDP43341.1 ATP-binding cassette subfamily B protein [Zavarzinia compransoris]
MSDPRKSAAADKRSGWQTVKLFLPYLWPRDRADLRRRVLLAVGFLVLAKIANVIVPYFYKAAVDALSVKATVVTVPILMIIAYGLARVGAQGFAELRDSIFARVGQFAVRRLGLSTFEHLHRLSLRFHVERRTGGLNRVIERGTKGIDLLLRFTLFNIAPTILEIGFVLILLATGFGWPMVAVMMATIVAYIGFTFLVSEWRIKYRRTMNDQDTDANTKAVDSLLNYETVKYFSNEGHEARRFDRALQAYEQAAVKSQTTLSVLNAGQSLIMAAGLAGVMYLAGRGVADGSMTVGDFVLVNTFLIQLYIPLNMLGFVYREIKQGIIDMEAMFAVLDVEEEVKDRPGAPALTVAGGEVRFEDVDFRYDARRGILKGVSFTVAPGSTVAIVGPSGAGKSTISRILFRFYDIEAGRVSIDGQDIREVSQESLRRAIGIVPQDTVLFNDTIRYNIRYGRPGATDEEVEAAARLARIHDFVVSLPDGYDSMVGERGLKLSGGEKQRVAIARTILKNPPILLLDEATSALDTQTEKEIQASLKEISRDRTAIVIAHRLSTVVDADEILVLDKGRIVERGTHEALLDLGGQYAGMWQRQLEAVEAEAKLAEAKLAETRGA